MYFDDLPIGYRFETAARTLSLNDILSFGRQYDPQPFHIDPEAAKLTPFGGIIASGFQTILTAFALTLECGVWRDSSLGSPGMQDIRWIKPVRPGDTLRVRGEVLNARVSNSKPDRGIIEIRYEILNQEGEVVSSYVAKNILSRKA